VSPEPANVRVRARREAVFAGAAVSLVCTAYLALIWYGFDLLEEGSLLARAWRVHDGALPFRDFETDFAPGVYYLYAWTMDVLGPNLPGLRLFQLAGRVVLGLALYLAARRLMPPLFAVLPPALVVAVDAAPEAWGLHPVWYAAPAAVLAVLALTAYLDDGRRRWLVACGVATAVGFAFVPRLATAGLLATLWFVAVAERHLPAVRLPGRSGRAPPPARVAARPGGAGRSWWAPAARAGRVATQVAALILFPLAGAALVRPHVSALAAGLFVLPLAALSAFAAAEVVRRDPTGEATPRPPASGLGREAGFYARPILVLAGFGAVTLPWVLAFARAAGGEGELPGRLGALVVFGFGAAAVAPPRAASLLLVGVLMLFPLIVATGGATRFWIRWAVAFALGVLIWFLVWFLVTSMPATGLGSWDVGGATTHLVGKVVGLGPKVWRALRPGGWARPGDDLLLYLPALAFWVSLGWLAAAGRSRRAAPDLVRLSYLAAGAALLLTQSPGPANGYAVSSGGLLLVAGADLLFRWYRATLGRVHLLWWTPGRAALWLSLVLFPLTAALPWLNARLDGLYHGLSPSLRAAPAAVPAAHRSPGAELAPLVPPGGGPPVWTRADRVAPIEEVVSWLRANTAPGEPILTYPGTPGFHYLADRPSATRFDQVMEGAASPAGRDEIIRLLAPVRYVVLDDQVAHWWAGPRDGAPVLDYIRTHFRIERDVGPYSILARRGEDVGGVAGLAGGP
jgi:hypothetical protein